MSEYTQTTDFSVKDALTTGDPEKIILGSDVDVELAAIATAIASKLNSSGYTAADVLAKLLTVDGAGSTLDADSVDGVGPFASGTYAPTFTAGTNVASVSSSQQWQYIRIGTIVYVLGAVAVDATAAADTASTFDISLPVASDFTNAQDLNGIGVGKEAGVPASEEQYQLSADTANNRADVNFNSRTTVSHFAYISFMYKVL